MSIADKKLKELVDHLSEFNLTELEYQEGQTKIKVSKATKGIEQIKSAAVVSPNKAVLSDSDDSDSDNSTESDFSSNSQSSWETDSGEEGCAKSCAFGDQNRPER